MYSTNCCFESDEVNVFASFQELSIKHLNYEGGFLLSAEIRKVTLIKT